MTTKSIPACVREIKRINAIYRRIKNQDSPSAGRLRELKDRLMDEMAAACPHPAVIATSGSEFVAPMRICGACGCCEAVGKRGEYKALAGRPATDLSLDEFRQQTGLILKRLGINL